MSDIISDIIAPRQVRLYAPTSLRNIDFLTEPTLEGVTGEDYRDNDIADGGLALNLTDTKVHRFVTAFDNKVANPQFKTDTDWTKEAGWTIDPGKPGFALYDNDSEEGIFQNGVVSSSQTYIVIVKCTELSIGGFTPMLGTAEDGDITEVGISIHIITANGTGFRLEGDDETVGKIEYIYVLDSNDYRFDLLMNSRKEIDFAMIDGQNILDTFPASQSRSMKIYHNTADNFSTATEIVVNEYVSGLLGKGRPFVKYNGIDAYSNIGDDPNLNFGADINFSIVFWVRIDTPKDNASLIDKGLFGTAMYSIFENDDGTLDFRLNDGSSTTSTNTTNLADGIWHHVAWTVHRVGLQSVYIDGVLEDSDNVSGVGDLDHTNPFVLGTASQSLGSNIFLGDMIGNIVYNRVIAPKEIEQMALRIPIPEPVVIGAASDFHAWINGNPIGWTVGTESVGNQEVTEVGTGQAHGGGGTGKCNIYSNGTFIGIGAELFTIGHKYRIEIAIDTYTGGGLAVSAADGATGSGATILGTIESADKFDIEYTATQTFLVIGRSAGGPTDDVTLLYVYVTDLDTLVTFPLVLDQWGRVVTLPNSDNPFAWTGAAPYNTNEGDTIDNWTNQGTPDANNFFEDNSGDMRIVSDGTFIAIRTSGDIFVADVAYRIIIKLEDDTEGSLTLATVSAGGVTDISIGSVVDVGLSSFRFTATAAGLRLLVSRTAGSGDVDLTYSSISIVIEGAVAAHLSEGISKEQDKLLDSGSNKLNGDVINAEFVNTPDADNFGYFLLRFESVKQDLYWWLSINEDNDLPVGLQKIGQWINGKQYLFDISALEEFNPIKDYPGVDVNETDSGIFNVTKRYGNRDRFIIPLAGQDRSTLNSLQEFMAVVQGMEYPFYMELLPLESEDESIFYRVRHVSNESPLSYLFGSGEPWFAGLEVVVDL